MLRVRMRACITTVRRMGWKSMRLWSPQTGGGQPSRSSWGVASSSRRRPESQEAGRAHSGKVTANRHRQVARTSPSRSELPCPMPSCYRLHGGLGSWSGGCCQTTFLPDREPRKPNRIIYVSKLSRCGRQLSYPGETNTWNSGSDSDMGSSGNADNDSDCAQPHARASADGDALVSAAAAGDLGTVRSLIEAGSDLEERVRLIRT